MYTLYNKVYVYCIIENINIKYAMFYLLCEGVFNFI